MSDTGLPRVLILGTEAFNRTLGGGITMSNLFRGWPRERIAAAHREVVPTSDETCSRYYRLGTAEIRRWAGLPAAGAMAAGDAPASAWPWQGALRAARALVFGSQLPDTGRLSPKLERWIAEFSPQLLYSTLGTNGVMELVLAVQRRFRLPLVVHFMDDWPMSAYRGGLLGALARRSMRRLLDEVLRGARVRLGICDAMSEAYEKRYGVPFRSFQNTIDVARWGADAPREASAGVAEVLYVGSVLAGGQLESLADCCQAVAALGREGVPVRLAIHSPVQHTAPHRERLAVAPNVSVEEPITDDEAFFRRLAAARVLLLPVDFDPGTVRFLRYSMPTKVPAYLCSGTPILAYGPDAVAQIQYACEAGWAHVVSRRGVAEVTAGLRRLLSEEALRKRLSANARRFARERHDATRVRREFQDALADAAAGEA